MADEIQWQNDLQDELEDAHGEHAEEYSRKITLYKDQLEKLEKQQSAKVCWVIGGRYCLLFLAIYMLLL